MLLEIRQKQLKALATGVSAASSSTS
jgi:hypothetical protein